MLSLRDDHGDEMELTTPCASCFGSGRVIGGTCTYCLGAGEILTSNGNAIKELFEKLLRKAIQ